MAAKIDHQGAPVDDASFVSLVVTSPPSDSRGDETSVYPQPLDRIHDTPLASLEETFEEMVMSGPGERSRILVVLDCANIGWHHGIDYFSVLGVLLALRGLEAYPVDVKAFLPAKYYHSRFISEQENAQLEALVRNRILCVVPSGDSDDAYILDFARAHNGFVISNDQYRDHIAGLRTESVRLSMAVWLQESRSGYAFSGDHFILNPSSALVFALRKETLESAPSDPTGLLTELLGHCQRPPGPVSALSPARALVALKELAKDFALANRPHLLEHVLLARCGLLLEAGQVVAAKEEARIVVDLVNPVSAEAHRILHAL